MSRSHNKHSMGGIKKSLAEMIFAFSRAGSVGAYDYDDQYDDSFSRGRRAAHRMDRALSQIWMMNLENKIDRFPDDDDFFEKCSSLEGITIDVMDVHSNGVITGIVTEYDADEETILGEYRVFVDASVSDRVAGCNCAGSDGHLPCSHNFAFANEIEDLLLYDSRFQAIVNMGSFSTVVFDPREYKHDGARSVLLALERLSVSNTQDDDPSLLPEVSEAQGRIQWDIQTGNSSIDIKPVYQTPKKRGNGYTKGRTVSVVNLRENYAHSMSHIDESLAAMLVTEVFGYSNSMSRIRQNKVDALQLLVGHNAVSLAGDPAEVRYFSPELKFMESKTHCWIAWDHKAPSIRLFTDADHLIRTVNEPASIEICKMPVKKQHLLLNILKLPHIPIEYRENLLAKCRDLQGEFSIKLPKDDCGELIPSRSDLVVLLRSRINGILDYGIRVRTSSGRIELPGGGRIIQPGTQDDQPVQFCRDANDERERAQGLLRDLALADKTSFDGSIDDFDLGMEFLAKLHQLESNNIEVLWDKSSEAPMRVLGALTSQNVSVGIRRSRDWFQLSGNCTVGNQSLDLSEVLSALQAGDVRGDFVRLGDKGWTRIEQRLRRQLNQLRDSMNQERNTLRFDATAAPAIRQLLDDSIEVNATKAWSDCLTRLSEAEVLEPELPENLNAELRHYQTEGYCWLRRLAHWGVGGILADDMGLGKTLQTLAVLLDRSAEGPALVIAPTSVGFNWVREAEHFAPDLNIHLYRETERAEFLKEVGPGDLVVCSYGLALRDADALANIQWSTLVLDEAQAVKNSRSKTSLAIAQIPAQWKVALTGTPVENHLGELWSLFRVISPGVLGNWEQFRKRFAAPIEREDSAERREALRERLKPFVLRRTKSEVLKDLPPRSEMNMMVELSAEERTMYDQVRLSAVGELDAIAKLNDVKDQRFRVLALLTRLRQLACSPALVHEQWDKRSAKLTQLVETVNELKEEGHRVLVFSQFVKHLTIIRQAFEQEGICFEYLDGSTPAAERQKCVDRFQNGDATAFLISLKAGGSGLNLTAADYVIHMDPWWNPAVEDQATDRAHRIGQDKPVMVYRLIAQGTIEEEILKLHDQKRDLIAGVMEGTNTAAKLTTEDLIAMVRG